MNIFLPSWFIEVLLTYRTALLNMSNLCLRLILLSATAMLVTLLLLFEACSWYLFSLFSIILSRAA